MGYHEREEVTCTVYEVALDNDTGGTTPGVRVECDHCEATTESYGRSDRSVRRCLFLLADQCDEHNFYVEGERITE